LRKGDTKDTDQEENADPSEDHIGRWECLKVILEQAFFTKKRLDTHKPNTLTKGFGKRMQDIYSWCDPFCEPVVTILGLAERGDLLSKDGEDSLG
jgi:hypothetical protein